MQFAIFLNFLPVFLSYFLVIFKISLTHLLVLFESRVQNNVLF